MTRAQRVRGQATVELALGSLLFVTVVMIGIYFGEFGILKLRVQQAAQSALFDTTGLRAHHYGKTDPDDRFDRPDQLRDADGDRPANRAKRLYRDFDATVEAPGSTMKMQVAQASGLAVTCRPAHVAPMPQAGDPGVGAPLAAAVDNLETGFGRQRWDGLQCSARATIKMFGAPDAYMERGDQGFFQAPLFSRTSIPVCAFGRARNGSCDGKVAIAIDDWGLQGSGGGHETAECGVGCLYSDDSGNQNYKEIVERIYRRYMSAKGGTKSPIDTFLDRLYTEDPAFNELGFEIPADERDFRFVFIGEDGTDGKRFELATREAKTDKPYTYHWPTTPYSDRYRDAYSTRGGCFLGSKCNKPMFKKSAW